MSPRPLLAFALMASAASFACSARAAEPPLKGWSAAALEGYSWAKSDESFATNTQAFGLALRGGYTFKLPIYVGLTYVRHYGMPGYNEPYVRGNVFYYGAEVGYELQIRRLIFRPYLGVGSQYHYETYYRPPTYDVTVHDTIGGYLTSWPGVAAVVAMGPLRLGVDVRYVAEAFTVLAHGPAVYATWGLHFD